MKRSLLSIAAGLLFVFLGGCEQDQQFDRKFARFLSTDLKDVTVNGVVIEASFEDAYLSDATDHGLVWGTTPGILVDRESTSHKGKPTSSSFEVTITADMLPNKIYYARAFVVVNDKICYGLPVTFKSLGSIGPIIHSVSPLSVVGGSLVTVTGEFFGDPTTTTVQLAGRQGNNIVTKNVVVKSVSNTEIVFYYPIDVLDQAVVIVQKKENSAISSMQKINIIKPEFTEIITKTYCDNIVIKGINLLSMGLPTELLVNGIVVDRSKIKSDSIVVDQTFHKPVLSVKMSYSREGYNAYEVQGVFENNAPRPIITGFAPEMIPENDEFVLEGINFPECGQIKVYMQDHYNLDYSQLISIKQIEPGRITFTSAIKQCGSFRLQLEYNGYAFYTSQPIRTQPAKISSITTLDAESNEFKIEGTGLSKTQNLRVIMNPSGVYTFTDVISSSETEIIFKVPYQSLYVVDSRPIAQADVSINDCRDDHLLPISLVVPEPTLTDFTPKLHSGFGAITITGSNFSKDPGVQVYLEGGGRQQFLSVTMTDTQLKTTPFVTLPSGIYKLTVVYLGKEYVFSDTLEIAR